MGCTAADNHVASLAPSFPHSRFSVLTTIRSSLRRQTALRFSSLGEDMADLTLREALASNRLEAFVRQEEARGVELTHGSDLERALALLTAQRRSKLLQHRRSFQVDQRQGDLVVTSGDFCAVYFKLSDQPQLILRRRTQTGDHELLALAWQAANDKARELGWIV
jgi:hypothetical protein